MYYKFSYNNLQYNLPPGVSMMADSSVIGDKKYTKAQHDIRGGI